MRIAQVSHSLDCGGSMAFVAALSCELAKAGDEVDLVCIDRPSGSAHEQLWTRRLAERGIAVQFLGRKPRAAGAAAAVKLWGLVQRRGYDVVHSHLPMPDAICGLVRRLSLRGFAHVITVHNTYEPRSRPLEALGSGGNVVYCSESVRERNPLPGVSSRTIPNGIPDEGDEPPERSRNTVRQELGLDEAVRIVIGVGRLCPQKNFAATLDALALLSRRYSVANLHCLLCGDGQERARLEDHVRELGLEGVVHFLGARTDVRSLLGASDVFLSTSLHEGMPLSVLEALSAGLPCVLSGIQEHYEIAESMPGCLLVSHAPERIALALDSALRHPPDLDLLRRQRATLLQKHSMARCGELYRGLYEACCSPGLLPHAARP